MAGVCDLGLDAVPRDRRTDRLRGGVPEQPGGRGRRRHLRSTADPVRVAGGAGADQPGYAGRDRHQSCLAAGDLRGCPDHGSGDVVRVSSPTGHPAGDRAARDLRPRADHQLSADLAELRHRPGADRTADRRGQYRPDVRRARRAGRRGDPVAHSTPGASGSGGWSLELGGGPRGTRVCRQAPGAARGDDPRHVRGHVRRGQGAAAGVRGRHAACERARLRHPVCLARSWHAVDGAGADASCRR